MYLQQAQSFQSLLEIWDAHHLNNAQKVGVPLLLFIATLLRVKDEEEEEEEEEDDDDDETDSQSTTTTLWTPQPNPYISKFNTSEWIEFHNNQWQLRVNNSLDINTKYGMYCPNEPPADYPQVDPMCPELILDESNKPIFK